MSMRQIFSILLLAIALSMSVYSQTAEDLADAWDKHHISTIFPSDVRHADLKKYLEKLRGLGVKVEQVGFSNASREIYQVEWGTGPLKVMMWSQMHGDEPTATSSLIDMFAFLQTHKDKNWVKKLSETITIRAVPMLNPDGQELYQRRNLQGIDINRDAVDLKTPEARLLKQLRDNWSPVIGFNLHNQQALTTVGPSRRQASISFLVVFGDAAKTTNDGHERNKRVASAMVTALQKFIPGHIGRYGDEWAPTAFGDNFSAWGTPTILIETGALYGKDEMYLVKMNFIAFLTALNSIATGSEKTQDPSIYVNLPENTSGGLVDLIFRSATIVNTGEITQMMVGDIAAVAERRRASFLNSTKIRGVGDMRNLTGLEEYDASSFYVVQRFGRTKSGEMAELFFYKKDRVIEWTSAELEKQFPPDAVFSAGKWTKGEKLVPRRRP